MSTQGSTTPSCRPSPPRGPSCNRSCILQRKRSIFHCEIELQSVQLPCGIIALCCRYAYRSLRSACNIGVLESSKGTWLHRILRTGFIDPASFDHPFSHSIDESVRWYGLVSPYPTGMTDRVAGASGPEGKSMRRKIDDRPALTPIPSNFSPRAHIINR